MTNEEAIKFIESYFVDTIEPDGVTMHSIDDTEWKSVKDRILNKKD